MTPKHSVSIEFCDEDFMRLVGHSLAREILDGYEPDIVVKNVTVNDNGSWNVDYIYKKESK